MANLTDQYIFGLTSSEYRPCYVIKRSRHGGQSRRKALFHKWTLEQEPIGPGLAVGSHPGGQVSRTFAVVEFEDGTVRLVNPEAVQFIDTQGTMNQLAWPENEAEGNDNL